MVALVVVDGTGPLLQSDPVEYDKFYKNSFCSRLARSHSPSSYTRGPVVQGTDTREKGDRAFRVSLQMTADPTCKGLVLVGHSRGARPSFTRHKSSNSRASTWTSWLCSTGWTWKPA